MSNLNIRKPTGQAPWPFVLVEGLEKTGKSFGPAVLSRDPRIGTTYWLDCGEGAADQYSAIDGVGYNVIVHDGSYSQIRAQVRAFTQEVPGADKDGKPNVFVFDSATNLWSLLKNNAQATANQRAANKARKYGKQAPGDDVQITMDLWNAAASQWRAVVDPLINWTGMVVFTARGKETAKIGTDGKPVAGEKDYTIEAHKTLPFDADVIVRTTAPGQAILAGFRSVHVPASAAWKPIPGYAENGLAGLFFDLLKLGGNMGSRNYTPERTETEPDTSRDWAGEAKALTDANAARHLYRAAEAAGASKDLLDTIAAHGRELSAAEAQVAAQRAAEAAPQVLGGSELPPVNATGYVPPTETSNPFGVDGDAA